MIKELDISQITKGLIVEGRQINPPETIAFRVERHLIDEGRVYLTAINGERWGAIVSTEKLIEGGQISPNFRVVSIFPSEDPKEE